MSSCIVAISLSKKQKTKSLRITLLFLMKEITLFDYLEEDMKSRIEEPFKSHRSVMAQMYWVRRTC